MNKLLALALLLMTASCIGIRTFESTAAVHGGYDGPGDADQIYLELRNREGQASGGYAVQLAEDWSTRKRIRVENQDKSDAFALEAPLELGLLPVEETSPPTRFISHAGEGTGTSIPSNVPLLVSVQPLPSREDPLVETVATRLGVGASAYILVDNSDGGDFSYDLYGAIGPPVQWVRLGRLDYPDSRGIGGKVADVTVRQSGYLVEAALWIVALTSPIWVWFVV